MNKGIMCVSVCSPTAEEMIVKIKQAEEFADVIEVRFDCLHSNQIKMTFELLEKCQVSKPLIATFRSTEQGGKNSANFDQRAEFWQRPQQHFYAADVEEDVFPLAGNWNRRIISFHDHGRVQARLPSVIGALLATDADLIKVAVHANDITDSIAVWKVLEGSKKNERNIIPIAMGEAGMWTRILGLAHGSYLTYASLSEGQETANGQITVKDMIETYRVKELDLNTQVFGVIGDPVSGSLSPYMHNAAFVERNINAVFIPLQVKDLDEFIRRMVRSENREVELNFAGFAVTMPHKQAIIKHLDAIEPAAEKIGAVNTVKIDGNRLIGYNTDAYGFITPLKERFGDLKDARVAVFGTGGAARACVYALKQEHADVTIFARDLQKAEVFADGFGVRCKKLTTGNRPLTRDIIVNATPIGMKGQLENETLFTAEQIKGVKLVYDLVTSSADTPIICEAKKANVPYIDGFEMLLHQGVMQFEIWAGQAAPMEEMRAAIRKKLDRKQ